MGNKTPPYPNAPSWTTARFWGNIRGALRRGATFYPPKLECMKAAEVKVPLLDKEGNQAYYSATAKKAGQPRTRTDFKCAHCSKVCKRANVEVDHIVGAGVLKDWDDLVPFVQRLYCSVDGLQVLCKPCHLIKTKEDKLL